MASRYVSTVASAFDNRCEFLRLEIYDYDVCQFPAIGSRALSQREQHAAAAGKYLWLHRCVVLREVDEAFRCASQSRDSHEVIVAGVHDLVRIPVHAEWIDRAGNGGRDASVHRN